VPGVGGQKPSSADRAFSWGVTEAKTLKDI